jgi:hypothetical protein
MKALKVSDFRKDWSRADESNARAPKMRHGKIPLASGIHSWPNLLFLSPDQGLPIVRNMCIYTHISKYVEIVYVLPLLSKLASETLLHKSVAVRTVDCIFIIGMAAWPWLGEYVALDKTSRIFKSEVAAAPVTTKFSFLSHSSRRPLLEIY